MQSVRERLVNTELERNKAVELGRVPSSRQVGWALALAIGERGWVRGWCLGIRTALVQKAIVCFLIMGLKEAIQSECIAVLYKETLFEELLAEAHDIRSRRDKCQAELEALHQVMEAMEQARAYIWT